MDERTLKKYFVKWTLMNTDWKRILGIIGLI